MPTLSAQLLRSRIGRVCVAVVATTAKAIVEKATATIKENPFVEIRLDYVDKPLAALPGLKALFAAHPNVTAIATCRRTVSGGRFGGEPAEELNVLYRAALAGFQMVDLPLETAEVLPQAEVERLRSTGVSLLVSYHDFTVTKDLNAVYERMQRFAPEFLKIVPTAKTLADNLTLLHFLERKSEASNVVGICMGEAGVISRVLGVRAGSAFTFGSVAVGEETAPGQLTVRTLREVYRIDELDAATKVYGVAGNPVRHSLSPLMLNSAFRRETLPAVYLALQATKVSDLLKLIHEIPIQGLSVTMPFKQEILPHLERTDPLSAKIGACNTVLRAQDGKLYGFNTDVAGIVGPLERRMRLAGSKVLVLGAGGAARAAVFGLRDKGAEVVILNRTPETAQRLAKQAHAKVIKREAVAKTHFDAIVNATPLGMTGHKGGGAVLEAEELNASLVFDLVYTPLETPLLRMARQRNIAVITGVEMFVQQGARQFEIWTGKPAPEDEMLRVVLHALKQQHAEVAGARADAEPPAASTKPAKAQVLSGEHRRPEPKGRKKAS